MRDGKKIRDFKCGYENSVGISSEVTECLDLEFPDAYKHRETMAVLARAVKEHDGAGFCLLPFCRTVETEAVGGTVNYGNSKAGPRAASPVCETAEDLLALPDVDFSKGRIREVLEACRLLADEGEHVCLEITGPWTQMQNLMDARNVFKMNRKQPEVTLQIMNKIGDNLLRYVDEAKTSGVQIITYSDSAGTLGILGPKLMEKSTREFTYGFVKKLAQAIDDTMIIQLCPKFAYALVDTGLAHMEVHDFGKPIDFLEATLLLRGKAKIVGQTCVKYIGGKILNGKVREIVLD